MHTSPKVFYTSLLYRETAPLFQWKQSILQASFFVQPIAYSIRLEATENAFHPACFYCVGTGVLALLQTKEALPSIQRGAKIGGCCNHHPVDGKCISPFGGNGGWGDERKTLEPWLGNAQVQRGRNPNFWCSWLVILLRFLSPGRHPPPLSLMVNAEVAVCSFFAFLGGHLRLGK